MLVKSKSGNVSQHAYLWPRTSSNLLIISSMLSVRVIGVQVLRNAVSKRRNSNGDVPFFDVDFDFCDVIRNAFKNRFVQWRIFQLVFLHRGHANRTSPACAFFVGVNIRLNAFDRQYTHKRETNKMYQMN